MADIELVIKISEDLYNGIERRDCALETEYVCDELMKAVDNAIPLPKGHGRLIDIDDMLDFFGYDAFGEVERGNIEFYIETQGAIIEVDKEDEE